MGLLAPACFHHVIVSGEDFDITYCSESNKKAVYVPVMRYLYYIAAVVVSVNPVSYTHLTLPTKRIV